MAGKTLYDKVWDAHVVHAQEDGTVLLYIDRHLVHEVTSPQAFEGLQLAGRKPWRTSSMLAVADHNVPTTDRANGIEDPVSKLQVDTLDENCEAFGVTEFKMNDLRQGIVHVIGPEQGATLPGMTVVSDIAGYDRRMRRFSYLYTWGIWSASLWNRDVRSGARYGNTNAAPKEIAQYAY